MSYRIIQIVYNVPDLSKKIEKQKYFEMWYSKMSKYKGLNDKNYYDISQGPCGTTPTSLAVSLLFFNH